MWGPPQTEAVKKVKQLNTTAPTLAIYNPELQTTVQTDASSYGLGAVLMQAQEDGKIRAVAYASRTLTKSERQYAQIEKECLGVVWGCERFSKYLIGLPSFTAETDHKPLIPLINTKDLSETPLRCQRLLMRQASFNVVAKYTSGKEMYISDALSRDPLTTAVDSVVQEEEEEIELHVQQIHQSWPMTDAGLVRIAEETQKDIALKAAFDYTVGGWPTYKDDVTLAARDLYVVRNEFSVSNGLLLRGDQIAIPTTLRREILEKIHTGHLGLNKCRERAKRAVWWPHITQDLKDMIARCYHCLERRPSHAKEPMTTAELPERPYQKVGADLLYHKGDNFLVVRDYYSRYIDVTFLPDTSTATVISKMKNIFSHHGIPELVVSDNGPQFASQQFSMFGEVYNFKHQTTSPHFPQANGAAESAVKAVKEILKQDDIFLALLSYRATPIPELGKSPAEMMYGRQLRTTLPIAPRALMPRTTDQEELRERDQKWKERQRQSFNQTGVRTLPDPQPGDRVLLRQNNKWGPPATVIEQCAPRSFLVETGGRRYRRNKHQIL